MDNSRFNIFEAVRDAYLFVGREWLYLLKAGALPVAAQIGTSLFIQFQRPEATLIEGYLWGLPATVLFAWFMFLEMRLLLLGERLDQLLREREHLIDRQRAMKLAVITSLLFNMGMSAAIALLMVLAESGSWGEEWLLRFAGLFLIGAIFWSLRFGIVPILAAVSYPIRPVLRRVRGIMFSFRLLGMALACLFPVFFLLQLAIAGIIDPGVDLDAPVILSRTEKASIIVISAPFTLLIAALLNAAVAFALKQILGKKDAKVVV